MLKALFGTFLSINLFASLGGVNTYEADFKQNITDENNHTIVYSGHMFAKKPNDALWNYTKPVKKEVYMNPYEVTIVEDELEQVIVKKVDSNFDFFKMIKDAKKVGNSAYKTSFDGIEFHINMDGKLIKTITYHDEFENKIELNFTNQKLNENIEDYIFIPRYDLNYDIIKD